jgi:2-haloacid dehalogenase
MLKISIQTIIFDFGGVLINWDPHELFKKYFANDNLAVDIFLEEINFSAWNLSQDKGYPFAQAVNDLSTLFPKYSHLIHAYDKEWEETITGTISGTVEILHKLKANGYRLYGLTNWSAEKFSIVRRKYQFFDLFEDIVVSGEVKIIKPDPAIFNLLLLRINRQPVECLIIDDSQLNLESARNMGFKTIHYLNPDQLEMELELMGIL